MGIVCFFLVFLCCFCPKDASTSSVIMRLSAIITLPLAASAYNIVMSNDDGWAEKNLRVFYNVLKAAGQNLVLSAPAENQSGTGE